MLSSTLFQLRLQDDETVSGDVILFKWLLLKSDY